MSNWAEVAEYNRKWATVPTQSAYNDLESRIEHLERELQQLGEYIYRKSKE